MFFPYKEKAYREARRVLKSGGRYVFSDWDTVDHNPFARILAGAVSAAFDADPPQFLRVPFGYAAIDPIKASVLVAGFAGLRIDVVRVKARSQISTPSLPEWCAAARWSTRSSREAKTRKSWPASWPRRSGMNSAQQARRRCSSSCSKRSASEGRM